MAAPPRPHPLLSAAAATHAGGAWRVSVAALAAAAAAQPSLGERRCAVVDYSAEARQVTVHWASAAAHAAWDSDDLGVMGDKMSRIARDNIALASIFSAAAQAAARGDTFAHVVATVSGSALQRIRFTPVDLEEELERAPAEAEGGGALHWEAAPSASGAAPRQPRLRRCMLDELLPADEASPQHDQLLMRALFADRYSSSLLTVVSLASRDVLYQNPASLAWHGFLKRSGAAGATWLAATLLGGDAALEEAVEEVAAKRPVRLRARVTPQTAAATANATAEASADLGRWHEVVLTPGVDPVTLAPVMVVTESDISSLKAAEAELSRLHEAQLADFARSEAALEALVCSCFPEHVASELLENLMAAREAAERDDDARRCAAVAPVQQAVPAVMPSPQVMPAAMVVGSPPRLGVMARRRSGGKAAFGADANAGAAATATERAATAPAAFSGSGRERRAADASPRSSMPALPVFAPVAEAPPAAAPPTTPGAPAPRRSSLDEPAQRAAAADDAAALLARVRAAGAQGRVAARRHSCVSVCFSDIKGFTALSSEADPLDVMAMLHELFVLFDALAERFGMFKLETIGDAYVAAVGDGIGAAGGGSPAACAAAAVQFGAACAAAAGTVLTPGPPGRPRSGAPVSIRVGVHSGPAMSGVVGTKMPHWALFGDTMNLAARMESTGLPGRVQVSAAARALADAAGPAMFAWSRRGEVDVKGKGVMATFLLRSGPGGACPGADEDDPDIVRVDG